MLLLAFDTATPAVTVALHDGAAVIAEESAVDARRHGELLSLFIEKVLRSAGAGRGDLTAVAVGTGPGPYTGLRAGPDHRQGPGQRARDQARRHLLARRDRGAGSAGAAGPRLPGRDRRAPPGGVLGALRGVGRPAGWSEVGPSRRRCRPACRSPARAPLLYPELAGQPLGPRFPAAAQLAVLAAARRGGG